MQSEFAFHFFFFVVLLGIELRACVCARKALYHWATSQPCFWPPPPWDTAVTYFWFLLLIFETGSYYEVQSWPFRLCILGWPWTSNDPPASSPGITGIHGLAWLLLWFFSPPIRSYLDTRRIPLSTQKCKMETWAWWYTPATPVVLEAEAEGSQSWRSAVGSC